MNIAHIVSVHIIEEQKRTVLGKSKILRQTI
jgi:hypothetical protein